MGNSIRIHQPTYDAVGRRNDEQTKQLRKAYSRKALKQLEEPASAAMTLPPISIDTLVQGLTFSQDRAGLAVCVDVTAGLNIMLREEAPPNVPRPDTTELIASTVQQRPELRELMGFAISDDFFSAAAATWRLARLTSLRYPHHDGAAFSSVVFGLSVRR